MGVYLWMGPRCSEVEIKLAYESAQVYIQNLRAKQPEKPRRLFVTIMGKESKRFTRCFHGWGQMTQPCSRNLPQVWMQGTHSHGALCCVLGWIKPWCHLVSLSLASRRRSYRSETSLKKTSQFERQPSYVEIEKKNPSFSFYQSSLTLTPPYCEKLCVIILSSSLTLTPP